MTTLKQLIENTDLYILNDLISINKEILPPYRDGLVLKGRDMVEYHNIEKIKLESNCFIPFTNDRKILEKKLQGNSKFKITLLNQGAKYTFYFKNIENKNTFINNPIRYLPGLGGFCLWGLAYEWYDKEECQVENSQCNKNGLRWPWTKYIMGPPADLDLGWFIYQDKIYFNFDINYRNFVIKDIETSIKLANNRWKSYYNNLIGPLNVRSWGRPNPSYTDSLTLTAEEYEKLYNKEIKYSLELLKHLKK